MARPSHLATFVLAAIALGLAAFIVVEHRGVSDVERGSREGSLFPAWRREDITRVDLEVAGERVQIARIRGDAGGRWVLPAREGEDADDAAVDKLLAILEHARPLRKVAAGASLGLDAPRGRVRVAMGALDLDLVVGAAAPSPEGATYARFADSEPIVLSKEVADELLRPLSAYRDRRISGLAATSIDEIAITRLGVSVTITRAQSGAMFVKERRGARVARDAAERLLLGLDELKADRFLAALTAGAPPPGALRVRVVPRGVPGGAVELAIGGECPSQPGEVVVHRLAPRPLVACAPRGPAAAFEVTADELADRRLSRATFDEIIELRLETDDVALEVSRKGSGFFMRSPEGRDLTTEEAESMASHLARLVKTDALDVTTGSEPPPTDPVGRLRLTTNAGDEIVQIARTGKLFRAMDGAWLTPSPALARRLALGRAALRPLRLLPIDLASAPARRLAVKCRGFTQSLVRDAEGFHFEEPRGARADGARALSLADALVSAKADAVVSRVDDRTFGTDGACAVEVSLDGDAGPISRRFFFGRVGEGGAYVRVEGDEPVLLHSESLLYQLTTPLVDRDAWRVDPGTIDGLEISRGGKTKLLALAAPQTAPLLAAVGALGSAVRAVSFSAPALPGAPPLVLRMRTRDESGTRGRVFSFAPSARDKNVYNALNDGSPAGFEVDRTALDPFFAAEL